MEYADMARKKKHSSKQKQRRVTPDVRHTPTHPARAPSPSEPSSSKPTTRGLSLRERGARIHEVKALEGGKAFSTNTKSWWVKVKAKGDQLWGWYRHLTPVKQVLWGLIVLPVVLLIVGVNLILAPLIAPALPLIGAALITLAKLTFVLTKFGAFAIYIGYKVLKGCLGIYYCVSRTLSGVKAGERRAQLAARPLTVERAAELSLSLDERLTPLKVESTWKRMKVSDEGGRLEHPLLLSYLRYFIIGQINLYVESWRERHAFFTIWRAESRETVKDQFIFVGTTIFRPYALGPHVSRDRVLLPGDARLVSISEAPVSDDHPRVIYVVEVPWRTWSFNRRWPLAHSEPHQARWALTLPAQLNQLQEEELGWRTDAVLETGGPIMEDVLDQEPASALEG